MQSIDLNNALITDLTPLSGLGALQTLNLSSTEVIDLTPLSGLGALQTLILVNLQVKDLRPLSGLDSLRSLCLFSTQVTDLYPLKKLISKGVSVTDSDSYAYGELGINIHGCPSPIHPPKSLCRAMKQYSITLAKQRQAK